MQAEFQRYSCQMALPDFNEQTQRLLQNAKVLIVGMGGLGCPAAQYLVAAGVGTAGIVDNDTISISNLHRQPLYNPEETGLKKVTVAGKKLQLQNPQVKIIPYDVRITSDNVMDIIEEYDIVLDGTDNFETKYLLNDACVLAGKPLVYGAIYQYEGQVAVWNVLNDDGTRTPNYRDLFPEIPGTHIPDCAEGGVIPTLAGITGCMQANEVIKYIIHSGDLLAGKLWTINVLTGQSRIINIGLHTKSVITNLEKTVDIPTISLVDLKKGITQQLYELIDVRSKKEHEAFNIGGKHIPLEEIKNHAEGLYYTKPLVFYCSTGKRSGNAVKFFKKKYPNMEVYSLKDGIKGPLGKVQTN